MTQDEATRLFYKHIWPLRAGVLRTARYLTRNVSDADDLTQETLVKAYRSIATFNESTHAMAWLTAILRNTSIDLSRSRKREARNVSLESHHLDAADDRPLDEPNVDGSDQAAMLEQLADEKLIDAIRDLPADICWALLLVNVQQMDYAEAALVMDVPVGTVKSRAFRGRQMLREKLLAHSGQARAPEKES